jgi:hypothetical protein
LALKVGVHPKVVSERLDFEQLQAIVEQSANEP